MFNKLVFCNFIDSMTKFLFMSLTVLAKGGSKLEAATAQLARESSV